jgi:phenylacetate-CoA ligase
MTPEIPVDRIQTQLSRCQQLPFYQNYFAEVGIDPTEITSAEAFLSVPFMNSDDVLESMADDGQFGGLYHSKTRFIGFTPSGADQFMPEYHTTADMEASAEAWAGLYETAGVGEGDVVYNTYGYEYFGAAHIFQRAAQIAGATVIPAGPGDTDRAVDLIESYDINVFIGNPSFAMKLARAGVDSIDTVLAGGEPFTAIPGYRQQLKDAFAGDVTAVDTYGLSEILPIAAECSEEHGLHVATDYVHVEVVDPETGEVLPEGERGELVVTHLDKESMPLVRYRTGDLTMVETTRCGDRKQLTLPRGVFGRVDSMTKIKGVKFFPEELGGLIASVDGLTGEYQVVVTTNQGVDHLRLVCEGDAPTEEIRDAVEAEIVQRLDEVETVAELDDDQTLRDERFDD